LPPGSLSRLWATVLLSIHGDGRGKRTALLRLAEWVVAHPDDDDHNGDDGRGAGSGALSLIGIALRSTRGPEAHAAVAALARVAVHRPALRRRIGASFPELKLELAPNAAIDVQA
jgi:hypothetical protein